MNITSKNNISNCTKYYCNSEMIKITTATNIIIIVINSVHPYLQPLIIFNNNHNNNKKYFVIAIL